MSNGPVQDWATDFDHATDEWAADPFPIWDDLRERCPIAHTDRYGGAWLPTRHDDISAIAYDTDRFTSRSIIVTNMRPIAPAPQGIAPPISSDPPFHHGARRVLLPAFAPKAVDDLEPYTRAYCHELIDALVATGGAAEIDAAVGYSQHIPVQVIAKMLGFPLADADLFRGFVKDVLEGVDLPPEVRIENFGRLDAYLAAQIDDHLANPRDDLTSFLLQAEMDGQPLGRDHVHGTIALLMLAGIDTTWSAIGASLWHLASHADDRARLVADPSAIPTAVEELLRAYAPVTMARLVKDDMEWHGVEMKQDEWVLLPFPAANRDPEFMDDPDEIVLDRQVNRHAAFGLGIHRCVGSHLARMELRVALEVWLERLPEFTLADPARVTWSHGQVRGPRSIPMRIG